VRAILSKKKKTVCGFMEIMIVKDKLRKHWANYGKDELVFLKKYHD